MKPVREESVAEPASLFRSGTGATPTGDCEGAETTACLGVERSDLSPDYAVLPGVERSDLSPEGTKEANHGTSTRAGVERSDLSPRGAMEENHGVLESQLNVFEREDI